MNNAEQISALIKQCAKSKKIPLKNMLSELGLGVNIISQFAQGREMSYLNLAKIAEYLDCSVDYLLGRTDNLQSHKSVSAVSVGNVSGNSGAIGVGNTVTTTAAQGEQQAALIDIFNGLDPVKQAKLLVYADNLRGE